jgi:hypothetical protein
METIVKIELPLKRVPAPVRAFRHLLPRKYLWFGWFFAWNRFGIGEFGGSRTNYRYQLQIFRRVVLTIHLNEYHDRSDKERADEYLRKWSDYEKELRGLRLIMLGDETAVDIKRVIKESLGVDLDEGTVR